MWLNLILQLTFEDNFFRIRSQQANTCLKLEISKCMVKVNSKEFVKGNNKGRRKTIIEVKLVYFMLTLIEHIKDNIQHKVTASISNFDLAFSIWVSNPFGILLVLSQQWK